jgi:hypothetical protein
MKIVYSFADPNFPILLISADRQYIVIRTIITRYTLKRIYC